MYMYVMNHIHISIGNHNDNYSAGHGHCNLMIPVGTGLMKNIEYHCKISPVSGSLQYFNIYAQWSVRLSQIALLCWDTLFGENEFFNFGSSNIAEY